MEKLESNQAKKEHILEMLETLENGEQKLVMLVSNLDSLLILKDLVYMAMSLENLAT